MDYNFQIGTDSLRIPSSAYKPIKRCSNCQSVYIDDKFCESCGRSVQFHPIGEPFGAKSFYGIKARYIEEFNLINRFFPIFENKSSPIAKSYVRKLEKRFSDLVSAFNTEDLILNEQKKIFFVESVEIINELLRYGVGPADIQSLLLENNVSLIGEDLLFYLQLVGETIRPEESWYTILLSHRLFGIMRTEFFLKTFIVTVTILILTAKYKDIISSQFGK